MTKRINKNKFINLLLLCVIFGNFLSVIIPNLTKYISSDYWKRYEQLKFTYENSQYVQKNPKMGWIPDELVYSYAGGALAKGINPTYIAAGSAPLGKYLISLSILLTGNENVVILVCGIFSLLLMYMLGMQIFSSKTLALIAPVIFSFEPIFKNQLIYVPLLDIMQIPFLLASLYFFNEGEKSNRKKQLALFILANIALGMFISVKFFVTGLIIVASWFFIVLLRKNKQSFIKISLSLPFSAFVLIGSYFKVFLEGYSLRQVLGIQKWIFLYHESKLIMPFTIWPLMYFNKWYVWYGDKPIISDGQWTIMWPIVQTITILTIVLYVLKKINKNKDIEVLIVWSIIYIAFSSFGNATSRYLVIYFPVIYIIAVFGIVELKRKYFPKQVVKRKV